MLGLVFMHDCGLGLDQDSAHESDVPLAQKRYKAVQEVAWFKQVPVPLAHLR